MVNGINAKYYISKVSDEDNGYPPCMEISQDGHEICVEVRAGDMVKLTETSIKVINGLNKEGK